jgi:hypothetical protein
VGYQFWVKVTAHRVYLTYGDSTAYLPSSPVTQNGVSTIIYYDLRVGCYAGTLSFTDSANFVTTVNKYVGDGLSDAYTFHPATPNRAWCRLLTNEFSTDNAEPWSGAVNGASPKFGTDPTTFQPYSVFNLLSTTLPEVISFRIKSTHTNTQIHYSPVARINIVCGYDYSLAAINTVTNPLYVAHDNFAGATTGFPIPTYRSS